MGGWVGGRWTTYLVRRLAFLLLLVLVLLPWVQEQQEWEQAWGQARRRQQRPVR